MQKTAALFLLLGLVGCGGSGDLGSNSATSGGFSSNPAPASSNVSTRLVPPAPPGAPGSVTSRVVLSRLEAEPIRPLGEPLTVSLRQGWNLFAMPFSPPTSLIVSQPANILGLSRYDASAGQYVDVPFTAGSFTTANPFTGYWLYCSAATQVTMDGVDQHQTTLTAPLAVGWNLVGTPLSSDVPTGDLLYGGDTLPQAFATFRLWPGVLGYDGSAYAELGHPPTVLRAGESQWIYAYQADNLRRLGDAIGAKHSSE
ncbi:MAG: hypothetical protein KF760_00175 [Candidatus Eremiobacteraeota bacterium]|nr:hypothetical protein [Candidatus Eremiobacteraeota bacterium]MCW5866621.1 hypothetical protein [Candidatus Eremiobacteraeota bacterium]